MNGTRGTVPLDPNSPHGKKIAAELTEILADIKLAIAEREAAARVSEVGRPAERAA